MSSPRYLNTLTRGAPLLPPSLLGRASSPLVSFPVRPRISCRLASTKTLNPFYAAPPTETAPEPNPDPTPAPTPIFTAQQELSSLYVDHEFLAHKHHFNTHQLVKKLEGEGFERGQAEVLMRGLQGFIRQSAVRVKKEMLTKSDIENESYLFRAALRELRTEIQVMRRQNLASLQSGTATTIREMDALSTRLREDVGLMKSDIQLDMNTRKAETREEQKALEIRIQEVNNRLTIALGDLRTEMEAMKWEMTRRSLLTIFSSASAVLLFGYFLLYTSSAPSNQKDTLEKDSDLIMSG